MAKEISSKGIGPSEAVSKEVIKRGSFKKKKSIFKKKDKQDK